MLRSGLTSPALGRYPNEQVSRSYRLDVTVKNYFGGTSITGHGYALYDGPHRREAAAVLIENFNVPFSIRPERDRWTQRLLMKLIAEDCSVPTSQTIPTARSSSVPSLMTCTGGTAAKPYWWSSTSPSCRAGCRSSPAARVTSTTE